MMSIHVVQTLNGQVMKNSAQSVALKPTSENEGNFVVESPKKYCPLCSLELDGNRHKNEQLAWHHFNCEYNQHIDEKPPIPEIVMNNRKLESLQLKKQRIDQEIQATKARQAELEKMESQPA